MTRPPRSTKPPLGERPVSSNNPFQNILDDDNESEKDFEKTTTASAAADDDEDSSVGSVYSQNSQQPKRHQPPRPSNIRRITLNVGAEKRRRRRSSARFLQLGGGRRSSFLSTDEGDNNPNGSKSQPPETAANLAELYQKAIRMNAENKINAGNSWNLRLIENIDKFLHDVEEEEDVVGASPERASIPPESAEQSMVVHGTEENDKKKKKRVNFTKASCTLDASVKIYSYRVDDVHLTSYKVLANLNRTDNNKKSSSDPSEESPDNDDSNDDETSNNNKSKGKKRSGVAGGKHGSTIETHVANINLNKLDSAFDIDPLFHKMSKTFDEGGAKGLLLVNLGIGGNGCNIVFDSSNDQQMNTESMEDKDILNPEANDEDKPPRIEDGEIDISSQIQKIESTLSTGFADNSIESIPLVPQLSGLRAEYALLEQQGFVSPDEQIAATVGPKTPGRRRYHADEDEERLADQSIHKEAMERSRLSAGNNISALRFDDESSPVSGGNNDDDFAGDYYDDDDGDAFDNFIVSSDHANRYSDFSLEDKMSFAKNGSGDDTKNLLDAISSGKTVLAESDYSYFDTFTSNNYWAGAAHWNRAITKKPLVGKNAPSSTRKPPSKRSTKCTASINKGFRGVDLVTEPDLSFLVENTKRKSASSIQLSRAMITKHTHSDNLLPEDAGFKVDHLVQLFLRPSSKIIIRDATGNSVIALESSVSENAGGGKTVGFNLPEWDAASFGDHGDDGPGYDFGGGYDEDYNDDDDEVLLPELEGVRKVEKVRVGFATVAKNVDVKRLKRDLWMELEQRFQLHASPCAEEDENDSMDAETPRQSLSPFSFQVAVNELEAQKSQVDATLPFYFICILHLANEKGLRLESQGLDDFIIHLDNTVQLQSY